MVVMEAVCDSSLVFSYVGGPNMWVSETDHSNCICSHEMSSTIHFLVPEEQPRGPAPFPANSRWAGASIGFSGSIINTHTTYLKENIKL